MAIEENDKFLLNSAVFHYKQTIQLPKERTNKDCIRTKVLHDKRRKYYLYFDWLFVQESGDTVWLENSWNQLTFILICQPINYHHRQNLSVAKYIDMKIMNATDYYSTIR